MKAGYLRVSATGIYRDLNFVVRNVPGFIPFETLPEQREDRARALRRAGGRLPLRGAHLTPGIGGGVQLPATFRSEFTEGGVPAQRIIVVRQQGDESILPYSKERKPIVQARVALRWDISEMFAPSAGCSSSATTTAHSSCATRPRAPRRSACSRARTASARRGVQARF